MANEIIHVGIREPKLHRKEILSVAIDIIELLKGHEKYKKIEKEKNIYRTHLAKNIKQLSTMLKSFETGIPKAVIKEEQKKEKTKAITKSKKKTMKKPVKIEKDENLDKLERDIGNIKSKISEL